MEILPSFAYKTYLPDVYTLPETNSSHLKIGHPNRKRSSEPTIHFSGDMLVFGGVVEITQIIESFRL